MNRFSQWLFNEGRNDWLTTTIVRAIMPKLKHKINRIRGGRDNSLYFCHGSEKKLFKIGFEYMSDYCVNLNLSEDFPIHFIVKVEKGKNIASAGGFQYPDYMYVELRVPYDFDERHLENVRQELTSTIRHELEHFSQEEGVYKATMAINQKKIGSLKARAAYYTTPGETEAFVMGLYKKAKTSKRPFVEVVDEYLDQVHQTFMFIYPDESLGTTTQYIDDIRRTWLDYAQKRLPVLSM